MARKETKTGGRAETAGIIPGDFALSVGRPPVVEPEGWSWTKLSDVARLETGHTPSRRHPEYWGGDVPWIGIKDATANHGGTLLKTNQYTNDLGIANSSARVLPKNTVCLSRTASVGYVVVMGKPMATSQDFVNWVCDPSKLDYRFLKYVLLAERRSFLRFSSGTTHQTIYFPEVKAFHVCLPPLDEQTQIAHILGTLDDKIELNRQINTTLESMAQALFKSWFVDFEPVIDNAMAAGNDIPDALQVKAAKRKALGAKRKPLPDGLQQQFPDRFVFTEEMGWVPEGWALHPIKSLGNVVCGKTPSTKKADFYGGDVPFITIPDMHGATFVDHTGKSLTRLGADSQKNKYLPPYSICVSCIATPGLVVMNTSEAQTNQQINGVVPNEKGISYFLYESLSTLGETIKVSGSGGSVFANLSKRRFEELKLLMPPVALQKSYSTQVASWFERLRISNAEGQVLSKLRDTLLPKLLSGELRIPDAEKQIAEVV